MAGTELLRIANLNKMEVTVEVNENDIVRVNLNDTATIELDAYFEKQFKGIVTEIANSASNTGSQAISSDQVTNFKVKILLLKSSYKDLIPEDKPNYYPFRPGMSATVDIQTKTVKNVLSLPIQAVTTRSDSAYENRFKKKDNEEIKKTDDELKVVVFQYNKDNTVSMKEVKTGIQDSEFIEILEGLQDSSEIVTAPYSAVSKKLKDTQKVEKTDKENLFKNEK